MTDHTIAESFLPEYDSEMASTRRLLERLPTSKLDWKPHDKSRSLGELATHVTELPRWGARFQAAQWKIGSEKAPALKTVPEFLARFDENVGMGRQGLAAQSDDQMREEFAVLRPDGAVFFQLPRKALVRRVLLSHLIHHRGQLTVYLRENDVALPSIYGPTADEGI
ncbi:MAG TPA: DinB family protein [Thermoanaerobaculia bacterium]|nr:DinB family protein [Thermoanaerobaculia bacterium]